MDQRILPQEIIKFILSFLNSKDAARARLVNTDWFRWIKYDKFDIYFPTPTLLPQIVDRLSTYQYPIELSLHKPLKLHDRDILDCISKLTQLKEFNLWEFYSKSAGERRAEPQEYFKLSTLTNLEILYFGSDRQLSPELVQHFPRMRQCDNITDSKELIQIVNTHCPYYQFMSIEGELLSIVPVSVTELYVNNADNSLEALTRLTKLKQLELNFDSEHCAVDLRHVIWLEYLMVGTINITGLEHSHHLTELSVSESTKNDASALLDSLTALPKLQKLSMFLPECQVTLPTLPYLTNLLLYTQGADTASLPTTLQELDAECAFELTDISHLVNLTRLSTRNCITTAIEPLHTLTKLQRMYMNMESPQMISLSTLTNLTYLNMLKGEVDSQTIKSLTNLQHWESFSPPTDHETIDNIQYLSHLSHMEFSYSNQKASFDYKVIEKLPLACLRVPTSVLKNLTVLPTLTTLEDLTIQLVEDEENIASLVTCSKLTRLAVMRVADNVTCVHLTRLTTLQQLNLYFTNDFSFSELSLKLTRLRSVVGISKK